MKFSKVIGALIALVQLASAVGLIIGMQSMLGVYITALPGGEQGIEIQFTDPVVVPFTLSPHNSGYVDSSLEVTVAMIVNGNIVASDTASMVVPAGSTVPVELELSIPLAEAQQYLQEGNDLQWDTEVSVSSLFDLISFSNHMVIEGGGE